MNRPFALLVAVSLPVFSGCGPKEPPAPVVPEKTEAELRREKNFGKELAADPAIAWRPSGLGIRILVPGEGPLAQMQDRVRVRYTGRLLDGTVFDGTPPAGKPAEFAVSGLVSGMAAGMLTLRPGGKAVFYIPAHLGYGGVRAGSVPPFSNLVFEVELVEVVGSGSAAAK